MTSLKITALLPILLPRFGFQYSTSTTSLSRLHNRILQFLTSIVVFHHQSRLRFLISLLSLGFWSLLPIVPSNTLLSISFGTLDNLGPRYKKCHALPYHEKYSEKNASVISGYHNVVGLKYNSDLLVSTESFLISYLSVKLQDIVYSPSPRFNLV